MTHFLFSIQGLQHEFAMKRHDFESLVQEGWSKFTSISEGSENDMLGERLKVMTGMLTKFFPLLGNVRCYLYLEILTVNPYDLTIV